MLQGRPESDQCDRGKVRVEAPAIWPSQPVGKNDRTQAMSHEHKMVARFQFEAVNMFADQIAHCFGVIGVSQIACNVRDDFQKNGKFIGNNISGPDCNCEPD